MNFDSTKMADLSDAVAAARGIDESGFDGRPAKDNRASPFSASYRFHGALAGIGCVAIAIGLKLMRHEPFSHSSAKRSGKTFSHRHSAISKSKLVRGQ